jgi:hypothetical protein
MVSWPFRPEKVPVDGRVAGAGELGLLHDERQRLREALAEHYRATLHGAHRVRPGICLDIDFHGPTNRPLRDPVARVRIANRPHA